MNSIGRLFSFRSLVRQWRPVTEGEIYVVLGLYMLMGIIQKPTLRSYFSQKWLLSTPRCGDVISRDRLDLITKFLHFADNTDKANYEGPAKLYKIFPVLSCPTWTLNFKLYSALRRTFQSMNPSHYGKDACPSNSIYHWKQLSLV
jgi:hypothetical protein